MMSTVVQNLKYLTCRKQKSVSAKYIFFECIGSVKSSCSFNLSKDQCMDSQTQTHYVLQELLDVDSYGEPLLVSVSHTHYLFGMCILFVQKPPVWLLRPILGTSVAQQGMGPCLLACRQ